MNFSTKNSAVRKKLSILYRFLASHRRDCAFLFLLLLTLISLQRASSIPKTNFLNIRALNVTEVLPEPPHDTSSKEKDIFFLKEAMSTRTKQQVVRAEEASTDSVFDFEKAIGSDFNEKNLPETAALFKKVTRDAKVAIVAAKDIFQRKRPFTWRDANGALAKNGYAYPSGHTTRAFLWETLLVDLFPDKAGEIKQEARQKAWNRVLLGRHYPDDVYGGEIYGRYLAQEFFKNPKFQEEWTKIHEEVDDFKKKNPTAFVELPPSAPSPASTSVLDKAPSL